MTAGSNWVELLGWGVIFVVAAVLVWKSLARLRKEKAEFAEAEACLQQGQNIECLRHLGRAHEAWAINQASLTPRNIVRDIDRLIVIVEMIGEATSRSGAPAAVSELLTALQEWRAVFSDRRHFRFGSHRLKPEFFEQEQQIERKIGQLRTNLRDSYAQLLC